MYVQRSRVFWVQPEGLVSISPGSKCEQNWDSSLGVITLVWSSTRVCSTREGHWVERHSQVLRQQQGGLSIVDRHQGELLSRSWQTSLVADP